MTKVELIRHAGRGVSRTMRRGLAIAIALPLLIGSVARFLTLASPVVCFGFAVIMALSWCVWLERDPDSDDHSKHNQNE